MQKKNIIDSREEAAMYRAWRTRAGKWLRDMFHDIRENDASIHWLSDEVLQALRAHWDSPEYKAKQVKTRASRGSARGGSFHTRGSTTIESKRLWMVNFALSTCLIIYSNSVLI